MKRLLTHPKNILASFFTLMLVFGFTFNSQAHCDRVNGPVAKDAREALESADITKALIWVGAEQEEELRFSFEQSLKAYNQEGAARELAEQHFMETTVRLHRQAEGMPYTGLKSAQPNPKDIKEAEAALETGDYSRVTDMLSSEIEEQIGELFEQAQHAKKYKDEGVEQGRSWVDAYVRYIVYIHGLHETIQAGPAHGVGEEAH